MSGVEPEFESEETHPFWIVLGVLFWVFQICQIFSRYGFSGGIYFLSVSALALYMVHSAIKSVLAPIKLLDELDPSMLPGVWLKIFLVAGLAFALYLPYALLSEILCVFASDCSNTFKWAGGQGLLTLVIIGVLAVIAKPVSSIVLKPAFVRLEIWMIKSKLNEFAGLGLNQSADIVKVPSSTAHIFVKCHLRLAHFLLSCGEAKEALQNTLFAIDSIYQRQRSSKLARLPKQWQEKLALAHFVAGFAYERLRNYTKARKFMRKGFFLWRRITRQDVNVVSDIWEYVNRFCQRCSEARPARYRVTGDRINVLVCEQCVHEARTLGLTVNQL